MERISTLIVGAGPAGLAMSKALSDRSEEHVLLERGQIANTWAKERWDSFRLLTPNWANTLPGMERPEGDPDAFMTASDTTAMIAGYAKAIDAPVKTETRVSAVDYVEGHYHVATNRGTWCADNIVIASGAFNLPVVPAMAGDVPVPSFTAHDYRHPGDLPDGRILVVGASATGIQFAREIHASGRPVSLATGEHVRIPRRYRGHDILWWAEQSGVFSESWREIDDLNRVRRTPSFQLTGGGAESILDLNALSEMGVEIVGRLSSIRGDAACFSGSLANVAKLADLKLARLLRRFDDWADAAGIPLADGPERFPATRVSESPKLVDRFGPRDISAVVWATGFRPDYSWLNLPVLERKGHLNHDGGVLPMPGAYAMGLPFMRTRKSTFIGGFGADAEALADHLVHTRQRFGVRATHDRVAA